MLDDQCVAHGGLWCTAGDPMNRLLLLAMLVLAVIAVVLVAKVVLGQTRRLRSVGPSPSIATRLSDWRKKDDVEEDE